MSIQQNINPITIAIPKGRLQNKTLAHFLSCGIEFPSPERNLIVEDTTKSIRILLVKNSDLLEYVHGGIASIGIIGSDIIGESPHSFFNLGYFPFGKTKICLIGKKNATPISVVTRTTIASKYIQFTRNFLQERDINANIIKLNGSIEIAPLLGLSPYIIDLAETGRTLRENGLMILEELGYTQVALIANKSLYKLNYKAIDKIVRTLRL